MKTILTVAVLIASAGCAAAQTKAFPVVQTETAFLDVCEQERVQREPASAPWARAECQIKWRWALAAGPMADVIIAMSKADGDAAQGTASMSGSAMPAGIAVSHNAAGIRFDWQKPGSEGHYNVTGALRSRGVTLQSLGCPQYPGASMKSMLISAATCLTCARCRQAAIRAVEAVPLRSIRPDGSPNALIRNRHRITCSSSERGQAGACSAPVSAMWGGLL